MSHLLAGGPRRKFYVTGAYRSKEYNDATLPAIATEGTSRIDALLNVGMTVWEETEFDDLVHQGIVRYPE